MRALSLFLFSTTSALFLSAGACAPVGASSEAPLARQAGTGERKPAPPPYWLSFTRGEFDEARTALQREIDSGGARAGVARTQLAFLDAVTAGAFSTSTELLRRSWAAEHDFDSGSALARLLALEGSTGEALQLARELIATDAPAAGRIDLLETLLADSGPSGVGHKLATELLQLDRFNAVALSYLFRGAVLAAEKERCAELWRRLHRVELLGTELYDADAEAVETQLRSGWDDPLVAGRVAASLVEAGYCDEALHVAADVLTDDAEETRSRARSFLRFRDALTRSWRRAAAAGMQTRWARNMLDHDGKELVDALGVESFGELYAVLRDRYAHHFVLDLESPLGTTTDLARVIHDAPREVDLIPEPRTVRRIVTGAPTLRFAWALAPLTAGAGTKHFFRSDWGETIVLRSDESIDVARRDWAVLTGAGADPAAHLAPLADPSLHPYAIVSAYVIGNQGNLLRDQMRRLALREALSDAWFRREDERDLETVFLGRLVLSDLCTAEVHEGRHAIDATLGQEWTEGEKELRSYLAEMISLPGVARSDRMSVVATGGNPTLSGNPHEWANLELVQDFVRILASDVELAPSVDRTRNLQAQLHRLSDAEIGVIATRIWQQRFPPAERR